jgi:hypothetical protein
MFTGFVASVEPKQAFQQGGIQANPRQGLTK